MSKKKISKQKSSHECCHEDTSKSPNTELDQEGTMERKSSYISGIVAGILACLCCCLPIIALAIGVATISNVAWFEIYHTQFELVGWLIMIAAVIYMWIKHRKSGVPMLKDKHFWVPLICMILVYSGMTFAIQNFIAPIFPQVAGHQH